MIAKLDYKLNLGGIAYEEYIQTSKSCKTSKKA